MKLSKDIVHLGAVFYKKLKGVQKPEKIVCYDTRLKLLKTFLYFEFQENLFLFILQSSTIFFFITKCKIICLKANILSFRKMEKFLKM